MKTNPFISGVRALLIVALAGACSDDVDVSNEQEVYFEVSYANQAWGNQFKGFLIDKNGQIRTYDRPAAWNAAEPKGTVSKEQMDANVAQTVLGTQKIAKSDLDTYISEAKLVGEAGFTKPENGGADLGLTSFYSYRYDATNKTYSVILLRQIGNVVIHNKDPNAKEIADWLTKVVDDVY